MDVTITVPNWEQYNPRNDVRCSWFRLEWRLPFSPAIHDLTHAQRWVWILILACCQEKLCGTIHVSLSYLSHWSQVPGDEVKSALIAFCDPKRAWVEISGPSRTALGLPPAPSSRKRNVHVTPTSRARTSTIRNDTKRYEEEGGAGETMLPGIASKTGAPVLTRIPIERQQMLVEKFGEGAVKEAAMDAAGWLASKPQRRIKNMAAFLRNWLAKDRPPLKSQPSAVTAIGDVSGAPTENVDLVPLPGPKPPWRK